MISSVPPDLPVQKCSVQSRSTRGEATQVQVQSVREALATRHSDGEKLGLCVLTMPERSARTGLDGAPCLQKSLMTSRHSPVLMLDSPVRSGSTIDRPTLSTVELTVRGFRIA